MQGKGFGKLISHLYKVFTLRTAKSRLEYLKVDTK